MKQSTDLQNISSWSLAQVELELKCVNEEIEHDRSYLNEEDEQIDSAKRYRRKLYRRRKTIRLYDRMPSLWGQDARHSDALNEDFRKYRLVN